VAVHNDCGNMMINKKNKGFSLIELMISLSIMSMLLMMAAPSFAEWLANMRVKSVAQGIHFGVMLAKAEAMRRNENVEFELNADSSWKVKTEGGETINQKVANEASAGVSIDITPAEGNKILFTGMGMISTTSGITSAVDIDITNVKRGMTVRVGLGGASLLCEKEDQNTTGTIFLPCRDI
jgi:type IV fimbrial biogenesis protein FimT